VSEKFEFLDGLEALVRHRVRFVVIGGVAASLRGSTTITNDLDVCFARDPENLERLVEALREIHARLRGAPANVPFRLDAKALDTGDSFTFVTDIGSLDVTGHPSGVPGGYEELERAAEEMTVGFGMKVKVASLDDLIRMKRAAGRPKDLIEVEVLGALRDEIDDQAVAEHRRRRKPR
jgi:predicted nucleotidyltransferase